jgi:hypothetical protein
VSRWYVEFPYLYRDASNYKRHGVRHFPVGDQALSGDSLGADLQRLQKAAVEVDSFVPEPLGIPSVYLFDDGEHGDGPYPPSDDDHSLHEFEAYAIGQVSADAVGELFVDDRPWSRFVDDFERIANQPGGWTRHMFDPAPDATHEPGP